MYLVLTDGMFFLVRGAVGIATSLDFFLALHGEGHQANPVLSVSSTMVLLYIVNLG